MSESEDITLDEFKEQISQMGCMALLDTILRNPTIVNDVEVLDLMKSRCTQLNVEWDFIAASREECKRIDEANMQKHLCCECGKQATERLIGSVAVDYYCDACYISTGAKEIQEKKIKEVEALVDSKVKE